MFVKQDFFLRPMTDKDLDIVHEWRNRDGVRQSMFNPQTIELENHTKWFKKTLSQLDVDYQILEYLGKPIGQANATNIDSVNNSCDWGFYLGEEDAKKGSGTVLGLLMLDYLFNHYQLEKVSTQILEKNLASLGLHKKLGFNDNGQIEKELSNKLKTNVLLMSLDNNTWDKKSLELSNQLFEGSNVN